MPIEDVSYKVLEIGVKTPHKTSFVSESSCTLVKENIET